MKSILLFSLVCLYSAGVDADMTCMKIAGIPLSCPLPFTDDSKAFCCYDSNNLPACCNLPEYIFNNTGILAGIVVAVVVILLLLTLCCCCCCSCCLLAKRRQRGNITYAPIVVQPVVHPNAYPAGVVYPMQTTTTHQPPPAYPEDPNQAYNPNFYKQQQGRY